MAFSFFLIFSIFAPFLSWEGHNFIHPYTMSSATTTTTSPLGVTFDVDPTKKYDMYTSPKYQSVEDITKSSKVFTEQKGATLLLTTDTNNSIEPYFSNGLVGSAFLAYNNHIPLVLKPDDIWAAIIIAFSFYIDKNPEKMRSQFVSHEGKEELTVYGGGSIETADYAGLVEEMTTLMDSKMKSDTKDWFLSDFTTTTPKSKLVTQMVLMGAMKHYFSYKMCLECGLPKVTLLGTLEDWQKIRTRVDRLASFEQPDLASWSRVLGLVLDEFVNAYQGKVDTDFWNRIAHIEGGGSGPRYLEGWIIAFIPFDDTRGYYKLNPLDDIIKTKSFGRINTNDIPSSTVEFPVTIDDNGQLYKTIFYAGSIATQFTKDKDNIQIEPSLDWALIDVTSSEPVRESTFDMGESMVEDDEE